MEIILISDWRGGKRRFHVGPQTSLGLGALAVVAAICLVIAGRQTALPIPVDPRPDLLEAAVVYAYEQEVDRQRTAVAEATSNAQRDLNALALRLGEMRAHVTRLDALGSRLVEMAKLDQGEFDFVTEPGRGGPVSETGVPAPKIEIEEFLGALGRLDAVLSDREPKLLAVEGALMNNKLDAKVYPTGRPVKKGWMSSSFGYRTDPITGKRAFHNGLDFAGRAGAEVIAVAAGVVVRSGRRAGYGKMVEVNHGNGYTTTYAHNQENLVKVGDTVTKGQTLALLGSTGRSTGTHVHFEVHLNGRPINPIKFVRATQR